MIKYNKINQFLLLIFLLVFLFFVNKTFLYSYTILQNDYETRMTKLGGYCDKYGYGFVKYLNEKEKFNKNISIINYGNYPSIESYFFDIKKEKDEKYLILINISESDLSKKYIKKNFQILEKKQNCYLVKKL